MVISGALGLCRGPGEVSEASRGIREGEGSKGFGTFVSGVREEDIFVCL